MLEPNGKHDNTINSEHMRCRGIPTLCITYKASQDNTSVLDISKNLYKGKVIEFGLIGNLTRIVCKNYKDHTVSDVTQFTRTAKYVRDEDDKLVSGQS